MSNPLISVVLPVYNAKEFLREAIESILNQTYTNFEFIIINDGSKDESENIIKSYSDVRIKYYSQQNKGLGATLNFGLSVSNGKYIARQDQDDISQQQRLEKQIHFLEKNTEVLLLGTRARIINTKGQEIGFHRHPTNSAVLIFDLIFNNPFVHSSVMFKKSAIDLIGNYNPDRNLYEDYDLWSRFVAKGTIANLPDVLLDYRHHDKGLSKNFTNFKQHALYNQGVKNLQTILSLQSDTLNTILALYHDETELFKRISKKELIKSLNLIAEKINLFYPLQKEKIKQRKNQYLRFFKIKLNSINRELDANNPMKLFFLKIESKLIGTKAEITNE